MQSCKFCQVSFHSWHLTWRPVISYTMPCNFYMVSCNLTWQPLISYTTSCNFLLGVLCLYTALSILVRRAVHWRFLLRMASIELWRYAEEESSESLSPASTTAGKSFKWPLTTLETLVWDIPLDSHRYWNHLSLSEVSILPLLLDSPLINFTPFVFSGARLQSITHHILIVITA